MNFLKRFQQYIVANKRESLLILGLFVVAGIAHAWNMFHYPYLENDEATYVSQAWSFITQGKLAPYTYWYDHAPAGWIFLAPWLKLTHNFLGGLMNSGRVFMLILHIATCGLLYAIAKKLTNSIFAAALTFVIFTLSPLDIYFQRRILLDNIMTFWLLISVLFSLQKYKLRWAALSAITFGIAVLTKETAIVVLPMMLILIYRQAHTKYKAWAISQWLAIFASVVALYLLYALLNQELFPGPSIAGGQPAHVSLLGTLSFQNSRGTFHLPWDSGGDFYTSLMDVLRKDTTIIVAGAVSALALGIFGFWRRNYWIIIGFILLFTAFLARGKLVINFYVIPLLPWLALAVGALVSEIIKMIRVKKYRLVVASAVVAVTGVAYVSTDTHSYRLDETTNQLNAISWLKNNLPDNTKVAIDDYAYPALRQEGQLKGADWFFKIELDPAIQATYGDNWRNIQYILLSHDILQAIRTYNAPLMKQALAHSVLVADFRQGSTSYINLGKYQSTNGDWAQIYKVKSLERIITQDSWGQVYSNFVKSYGQATDPQQPNLSTSQRQADFMKVALQENQNGAFDGLWSWSKDHLQHRAEDKLLSSTWVKRADGTEGVGESSPDIAANADMATELIQAGEKWKRKDYREAGNVLIAELWRQHAVSTAGKTYLAADITAGTSPTYINLEDLRVIAAADPLHPWTQIATNEYAVLQAQAVVSPIVTPSFSLGADGSLGAAANTVPEDTLDRVAADLNSEVVTANDARAKALLAGITAYFKAHLPVNAVYFRNGSAASGTTLGYAPAAATMSEVAMGDNGAGPTYLQYLSPLYDSKQFLFRPYDNPELQIAIDNLLTQADMHHISIVRQPK